MEVGPGDALVIPIGWSFQFAAGESALTFLCFTSPPWPGEDEAQPASLGGLGSPTVLANRYGQLSVRFAPETASRDAQCDGHQRVDYSPNDPGLVIAIQAVTAKGQQRKPVVQKQDGNRCGQVEERRGIHIPAGNGPVQVAFHSPLACGHS